MLNAGGGYEIQEKSLQLNNLRLRHTLHVAGVDNGVFYREGRLCRAVVYRYVKAVLRPYGFGGVLAGGGLFLPAGPVTAG